MAPLAELSEGRTEEYAFKTAHDRGAEGADCVCEAREDAWKRVCLSVTARPLRGSFGALGRGQL